MKMIALDVIAGILALVFALYLAKMIMEHDAGSKEMQEISNAVRKGALAFLKREYQTLVFFIIILFAVISVAINTKTGIAYLVGTGCSVLAGFLGMQIATKANVRTTQAASKSLGGGLKVAFASGTVMGLCVVGLGIIGISVLYSIFDDTKVLFGFSLGASSIALFARVGGGIYTKAADVGADLVGKVEAGIPEDDPRNPAVIADNVGDNVGDVAGMGADLFESYVGSIIAAMALSAIIVDLSNNSILLPLHIAALGVLCAILGTFFVKTGEKVEMRLLLRALRKGIFIAAIILALTSFLVIKLTISEDIVNGNNKISESDIENGLYFSLLIGLLAGILIGLSTEFFTSESYGSVKKIAKCSETGSAINIIEGLSVGMMSTIIPVIIVVTAILSSFYLSNGSENTTLGVYGVSLTAVGMLSTLGITLATDAYGPVADNAGGIAEMSKLDPIVRKRTDALDALGNTTAATGKGFAIASAALTALAFIFVFMKTGDIDTIDISEPKVMAGIFIGAMLPFVFSALVMKAVGTAAFQMVEEVRYQFKHIEGLMEGKTKPNYERCIDISTKSALKEMIAPGTIAILTPIIVGLTLGVHSLGGMLLSVTATGFILAIMMANAGGAWDNAKKYIELGQCGGKGSAAHKAAVVGDTVGDPFKDTAGPSLNILIKLMSIVSLVFLPIF